MFPSFVFIICVIFIFYVMALKEYEFSKISSVCLEENDYWNEFVSFIKGKSFKYQVVYTDGLVSSCKSDKEGREAFGFVINGEIIRFDAPDDAVKLKDSGGILKENLMFSGLPPYCPSYATLRYIRKNLGKINRFIKEFNGDQFKAGWYASCSEMSENTRFCLSPCNVSEIFDKKVYAVHTTSPRDVGYSYATGETEDFIRVCYLLY